MADGIRRRAWLAGLLAATIALLAVTRAEAHSPVPVADADDPVHAASLPEGVRLLRGAYAPPRQPDGNSVLFAAPDGWVVVDSGRHREHAQRLLQLAEGRIAVLVNSHWHLDHVGGNPVLRAAHPDLQVLATAAIDEALDGFLVDYAGQLRGALAASPQDPQAADWQAELARIDGGAALRPDRVLAGDGDETLAGHDFHLGVETGAVTGGDVWVLDTERGVLAAGDLVTLPAPFLDTACPRRWSAALARLETQPFDVLIPGHGPPLTRDGLSVYRQAFDGLVACAASAATDADCVQGWLQAAAPLLVDADDRAQAGRLLGYYLPQVLRAPKASSACAAASP